VHVAARRYGAADATVDYAINDKYGVARHRVRGDGSLYYGAKLTHAVPTGSAGGLFVHTLWWGPVVGYSSKPSRLRWGVEAVPLIGDTSTFDVGAQAWLRFAPGFRAGE
jgi:hypothetical protein